MATPSAWGSFRSLAFSAVTSEMARPIHPAAGWAGRAKPPKPGGGNPCAGACARVTQGADMSSNEAAATATNEFVFIFLVLLFANLIAMGNLPATWFDAKPRRSLARPGGPQMRPGSRQTPCGRVTTRIAPFTV